MEKRLFTLLVAAALFMAPGFALAEQFEIDDFVQISGSETNESMYISGNAGDVNGDGFDDIIIGASGHDDAGIAYLIYGSSTALTDMSITASSVVEFTGETASDGAGYAVAGVGDINNDGFDDLVVTARYSSNGEIGGGVAYLLYGQSTQFTDMSLGNSAFVQFTGENASDNLGLSVAGVGDVNNDGFDDFMVTSPYHSDVASNAGAAYLVYGKSAKYTTTTISTAASAKFSGSASEYIGTDVAGVGDVNNDSYDDFVIGTQWNDDAGVSNNGAAYLVYGKTSEFVDTLVTDSSIVQFIGQSGTEYAGTSVSGGDLNGDSYSDIVVGGYRGHGDADDSGIVYVIYGQSTALTSQSLGSTGIVQISGAAENDYAGLSVAADGDVNGDGINDILIGVPQDDSVSTNTGATHIIYGSTSKLVDTTLGEDVDEMFVGEGTLDRLGNAVAFADANGDGFSDVLAGAINNSDAVSKGGAVYLLYGNATALTLIHNTDEYNNLECGVDTWSDPGATGGSDVTGTANVSDIDESTVGDTTITYSLTGLFSRALSVQRTVTVQDTTGPTITVVGDTSEIIEAGGTYTDDGATVADICDSSVVVSTAGSVDVDTLGEYTVTYAATDDSSNQAIEKSRTVTVQDTTAPVITLSGESTITITEGDSYTDAGATAIDSFEGNITDDITTSGTVDTATPGSYTITYSVSDSSDNEATAIRTVVVEEEEVVLVGDTEEELGAVVSFERQENGDVEVTYEDGSIKAYRLFNISSKPLVQLHTNGDIFIAINKTYMRTFDAYSGEQIDQVKLFKSKQYKTKFKRFNIYKNAPGKNNVMVLAQTKKKHKKQFKLRSFVVKNGGNITKRPYRTIRLTKNAQFAKLSINKNKKSGKKARILIKKNGKTLKNWKYKVTKKKGIIKKAS